MDKYPRFLKAMPEFYGLSFIDLGFLMFGLYLGMIFSLDSIVTIITCLALIGSSVLIRKYIDLTALILPRKKEIKLSDYKGGRDEFVI